jgi:hypothetical protein
LQKQTSGGIEMSSQLAKSGQSIEAKLQAAGIDPDSDRGAAIAMSDDVDAAIAQYQSKAIAHQPPSPPVVRSKGGRGSMEAVDLAPKSSSKSGDIVGARKAGAAVGFDIVDPLMASYEGGIQAGMTAAVEASQLRVQGFLDSSIASLNATFRALSGEVD